MRGWVSLGGGDEFGLRCERGDRALLTAVGGTIRVAVIPTAQADGGSDPLRAGNTGVRYFQRLGVEAHNVLITDRQSASDPARVADIQTANLVYLIGGNPGYLLTTLRDTPAMDMIISMWHGGTTVCGSSAGAMILCAAQIGRFSGARERWIPALGLVPQTLAAVHHEHAPVALGWDLLQALPVGYRVIGIDACALAAWGPNGQWHMLGNGSVRVYENGGQEPKRYSHGQSWDLPSNVAEPSE